MSNKNDNQQAMIMETANLDEERSFAKCFSDLETDALGQVGSAASHEIILGLFSSGGCSIDGVASPPRATKTVA